MPSGLPAMASVGLSSIPSKVTASDTVSLAALGRALSMSRNRRFTTSACPSLSLVSSPVLATISSVAVLAGAWLGVSDIVPQVMSSAGLAFPWLSTMSYVCPVDASSTQPVWPGSWNSPAETTSPTSGSSSVHRRRTEVFVPSSSLTPSASRRNTGASLLPLTVISMMPSAAPALSVARILKLSVLVTPAASSFVIPLSLSRA